MRRPRVLEPVWWRAEWRQDVAVRVDNILPCSDPTWAIEVISRVPAVRGGLVCTNAACTDQLTGDPVDKRCRLC